MDLSQGLWSSFVGSTLIVLNFIIDLQFLEKPQDALGSRVVEVVLRDKATTSVS